MKTSRILVSHFACLGIISNSSVPLCDKRDWTPYFTCVQMSAMWVPVSLLLFAHFCDYIGLSGRYSTQRVYVNFLFRLKPAGRCHIHNFHAKPPESCPHAIIFFFLNVGLYIISANLITLISIEIFLVEIFLKILNLI